MNKRFMKAGFIQIVSALLMAACASAYSADLPKAGHIALQSMFKAGSPTKFNDDYSHNTVTGVTFNEAGSGALHLAKVACSASIFTRDDINKTIGFCTFEDKDGDNMFVQYSAINSKNEFKGVNDILGGTGKFKGIRGGGPVECANTDSKGEFPCTETLDYQLAK